MPQRVQRKRREKLPPGARYVGRPTFYGNPFRVGLNPGLGSLDAKAAVAMYRAWLTHTLAGQMRAGIARQELAGRDLACWCPPGEPCHADVLIEIANNPTESKS